MPFTVSDLKVRKQEVPIELIALAGPPSEPSALDVFEPYLKVSVAYSKGGINYFTYQTDRRGYYLHVTKVELSRGEHFFSERFTMGQSGKKAFLDEAKAFNAKTLAKIVATVRERPIYEELKANVLTFTNSEVAA